MKRKNKHQVTNRLSSFAQQLLILNGNPFSLEARPHLWKIYNQNKKKTLLVFSRQAEKSTTLGAKAITRSCIFPFFKSLYVAPRGDQVATFSHQKLHEFIDGSPKVEKYFQDKNCKKSVFFKTFTNGSELVLRSSYLSPDAIRGISSDCLYIDEIQDIVQDHLPVIESCLQHGKPWARFREYAGTPKSFQNPINQQWNQSLKIEWIIKCMGCNSHNLLGMKNIGKMFMICSKCGKQIFPHDGRWEITNTDGKFPAFRICYLMVPWCMWYNPKDKAEPGVIQMLDDWSEAKFRNETLAESFDNADNPITEDDLKACCEDYPLFQSFKDIPQEMGASKSMVAGVDWGTSEDKKSRTVLSIGTMCSDRRFRVLFMKKYSSAETDPRFQVDDIARICKHWGVVAIGADWGFGYMQNAELSSLLPNRVQIMYTSGNQKAALIFEKKVGYYSISRSQTLSKLFLEILHKNIKFFNWKDENDYKRGMDFFAPDFVNVSKEYNENTRMTHYIHPLNVPDDALMSLNYALCANMILRGQYSTNIKDRTE